MQAAPLAGCEHPRVDLQVQVTMRITGAGGVVPRRRRFERLDRHLYLVASWPDPGGGVLGEQADDLVRGMILRTVIGDGISREFAIAPPCAARPLGTVASCRSDRPSAGGSISSREETLASGHPIGTCKDLRRTGNCERPTLDSFALSA